MTGVAPELTSSVDIYGFIQLGVVVVLVTETRPRCKPVLLRSVVV